jgi:hypothetical protein
MESKPSVLARFGIPAALFAVGLVVGSLFGNSLNGHGPESGFAGMFLAAFVAMIPAGANLVAMFARGTRAATYAMGVGVVSAGVFCGLLFLH